MLSVSSTLSTAMTWIVHRFGEIRSAKGLVESSFVLNSPRARMIRPRLYLQVEITEELCKRIYLLLDMLRMLLQRFTGSGDVSKSHAGVGSANRVQSGADELSDTYRF